MAHRPRVKEPTLEARREENTTAGAPNLVTATAVFEVVGPDWVESQSNKTVVQLGVDAAETKAPVEKIEAATKGSAKITKPPRAKARGPEVLVPAAAVNRPRVAYAPEERLVVLRARLASNPDLDDVANRIFREVVHSLIDDRRITAMRDAQLEQQWLAREYRK